MKQYLLLLAGLMILAPYGQADAKAVKLGRGNAYSVAADANLNTGANDTQLKKGECETNEECPSDKKYRQRVRLDRNNRKNERKKIYP